MLAKNAPTGCLQRKAQSPKLLLLVLNPLLLPAPGVYTQNLHLTSQIFHSFQGKILVFLIRILIRSAFDSLLDPYSYTDPHLGSLRNIMKCHIAPKHV